VATLAGINEQAMNGRLNRCKVLEEKAEDQPNDVFGMV
jgi:hypothetical protein